MANDIVDQAAADAAESLLRLPRDGASHCDLLRALEKTIALVLEHQPGGAAEAWFLTSMLESTRRKLGCGQPEEV